MAGGLPTRVVVLSGGTTSEHEVSLSTGVTVARELLAQGFDVFSSRIERDGCWTAPRRLGAASHRGASPPDELAASDERLDPLDALRRWREIDVDVVFNALHGPGGEDGSVQGLLRHLGIPFTGPDGLAAAVTIDKALTKRALQSAGIRTPRWSPFPCADVATDWSSWQLGLEAHIPMPWIVKPRALGSSVGIEVFECPIRFLRRALDIARREWSPRPGHLGCLLEERVRGRELTCAVIETGHAARALPPVEIRPRGTDALFDYAAKYSENGAEELCPAPIDAETTARVEALAIEVHRLFDCGPLSRTDLFLEPDGELSVLEVNTLPGMTPTSLVPRSLAAAGIPLGELLADLVRHALERTSSTPASGGLHRSSPICEEPIVCAGSPAANAEASRHDELRSGQRRSARREVQAGVGTT